MEEDNAVGTELNTENMDMVYNLRLICSEPSHFSRLSGLKLSHNRQESRGDSMEPYFKIGEVAEMFNISVRALHLYDKMGLFQPEFADETTGYRYYAPDQISTLNTILSFKKIGLSLAEIKTIFDNHLNPEKLQALLKEKVRYYQSQIDIITYNIENMERIIGAVHEFQHRHKDAPEETEQARALKISRIACLENLKMEDFFAEILWL
jgi:DNA-binding transcriptional MerR regulator